MSDVGTHHDELRPLMFSIAYRMTGSVAEAEDVVQDAFLRMHVTEQSGEPIDNVEAFATTVTTRLAIDALRSARTRRERYVGTWLPEPILEGAATAGPAPSAPLSTMDPAGSVERTETLSVAVLVLLEELGPVERAVFVLREALGDDYRDIARIVGKSEANCRQLYSRAKRRIEASRPDRGTDPGADRIMRSHVVDRFVEALQRADLAGLEDLLAGDAVFVADGGGRAPAVTHPVEGATAVARFLAGLMRRGMRAGTTATTAWANQPWSSAVRTTGCWRCSGSTSPTDGSSRSTTRSTRISCATSGRSETSRR
jgi:RNA polymerase sigma factor (sigma-70 family)